MTQHRFTIGRLDFPGPPPPTSKWDPGNQTFDCRWNKWSNLSGNQITSWSLVVWLGWKRMTRNDFRFSWNATAWIARSTLLGSLRDAIMTFAEEACISCLLVVGDPQYISLHFLQPSSQRYIAWCPMLAPTNAGGWGGRWEIAIVPTVSQTTKNLGCC